MEEQVKRRPSWSRAKVALRSLRLYIRLGTRLSEVIPGREAFRGQDRVRQLA